MVCPHVILSGVLNKGCHTCVWYSAFMEKFILCFSTFLTGVLEERKAALGVEVVDLGVVVEEQDVVVGEVEVGAEEEVATSLLLPLRTS